MHADGKAAIGYSSRELACEAGELLLQEGATQIGVLSVSTADRFQQVIAQLARHDVRYLLWDHVGEEAGSRVIDLKPPE
ncbi:hypothetical protein Pan44_45880 [Caulifigura coniformis]|uniref:Uncharacterized protein n=2 Tax=Caulifigura coniformis TaxID=2527983 RepID=A0A517SK85_9PLAN|nr:hypothetical protein Pan44_45880 [Caulifigura coniformis]